LTAVDVEGMRCNTDLRAVRGQLLKACAPSTRKFNIELPHEPTYDVKNSIDIKRNNATNVQANVSSNVSQQIEVNGTPTRGINHNRRQYTSIPSKAYKNLQAAPLIAQQGNQPLPIQARVNGSYFTNKTAGDGTVNVNPSKLTLNCNRPNTSMTINSGRNIDLNSNISSRNFHLAPRAPRGEFSNGGSIPSYDRKMPSGISVGQSNIMQVAHKEQYKRH
jgi:hypothetical protein